MTCKRILVPVLALSLPLGVALLAGCPQDDGLPPGIVPPDEAFYVGADACSSCHANFATLHSRTAHARALTPVLSQAPAFPPPAAGVPAPPPGFDWADLSYLIGGYTSAARFVNTGGFMLTGPNAQYNLAVPEIGLIAGFVPFRPEAGQPVPFDYDDFFRLTTGPLTLEESGGLRQENRPGIGGTFAEAGVQCEACHGPGSLHVPDPSAGNINLDANSASCARCHSTQPGAQRITVTQGLIDGYQQFTEVQASPHAGFSCSICHNPHASAEFDPANAIRNRCEVCHADLNMALHAGVVFRWGDYEEEVTCVSCHMPFAVKTRSENTVQLTTGTTATFGDTQSHIFRLDPSPNSLDTMFAENGTLVARDQAGQSSVSTCYVCQRCHHGLGNAFAFPPDQGCAFGEDIHLRR